MDDLEITSSDVEGSSFRVFKIDRIEIDLSWRSLIKGEKRFDRVEVVGVEVDLSLESLKSLMKSREEAIVTAVPDDLEVVDDGSHPNKPLDPADPKTEDSSFEAPAIDQQPNDQRAVTIAPVDDFEGLVVFKDVKARIYSEAVPEFELIISRERFPSGARSEKARCILRACVSGTMVQRNRLASLLSGRKGSYR